MLHKSNQHLLKGRLDRLDASCKRGSLLQTYVRLDWKTPMAASSCNNKDDVGDRKVTGQSLLKACQAFGAILLQGDQETPMRMASECGNP